MGYLRLVDSDIDFARNRLDYWLRRENFLIATLEKQNRANRKRLSLPHNADFSRSTASGAFTASYQDFPDRPILIATKFNV